MPNDIPDWTQEVSLAAGTIDISTASIAVANVAATTLSVDIAAVSAGALTVQTAAGSTIAVVPQPQKLTTLQNDGNLSTLSGTTTLGSFAYSAARSFVLFSLSIDVISGFTLAGDYVEIAVTDGTNTAHVLRVTFPQLATTRVTASRSYVNGYIPAELLSSGTWTTELAWSFGAGETINIDWSTVVQYL